MPSGRASLTASPAGSLSFFGCFLSLQRRDCAVAFELGVGMLRSMRVVVLLVLYGSKMMLKVKTSISLASKGDKKSLAGDSRKALNWCFML